MAIRNKYDLKVNGIPGYLPGPIADECRMQLIQAVEELLSLSGLHEVSVSIATDGAAEAKASRQVPDAAGLGSSRRPVNPEQGPSEEMTVEQRAEQYQARAPLYDFDFLVVPDEVREDLLSSVDLIKLEDVVFDSWNLRSIEPFPRSALNLHGPSGTGKTLAAHALAAYLAQPILPASYGQIESKFVGDSSKNVEAVFHAAERDNAVLFIDEADSLLSKRLTTVTQGADQAINSMRSQLLICLERYKGLVIFSTNLVENYDQAFETRMRNVRFPLPDADCRRRIWRRHLPSQLPVSEDLDIDELGAVEEICGRDIKNAVIDAALRAARTGRPLVSHQDLLDALDRVKSGRLPR